MRSLAATALGRIRVGPTPRAFKPLCAALGDDNASVRRGAASALGEMIERKSVLWPERYSAEDSNQYLGPCAVEPLCAALRDDNPDVRSLSGTALGGLGLTAILSHLIGQRPYKESLLPRRTRGRIGAYAISAIRGRGTTTSF